MPFVILAIVSIVALLKCRSWLIYWIAFPFALFSPSLALLSFSSGCVTMGCGEAIAGFLQTILLFFLMVAVAGIKAYFLAHSSDDHFDETMT